MRHVDVNLHRLVQPPFLKYMLMKTTYNKPNFSSESINCDSPWIELQGVIGSIPQQWAIHLYRTLAEENRVVKTDCIQPSP